MVLAAPRSLGAVAMNIHIKSELQRQHEAAKEARDRLNGRVVPLQKFDAAKAKIANLESVFQRTTQDNVKLRDRVRFLEAQLFEAQSRIISQEQRIYALSEMKEAPITGRRSIQDICDEILSDYEDVTWEKIISDRRTRAIIRPRHLCYLAVCAERPDLSIARIARSFRRDHSSILHVLKKHGLTRKGELE